MPGDVDYAGMEYALAVADQGARKVVSLATSFDTEANVLDIATKEAREALAAKPADLTRDHETAWAGFWSGSGLAGPCSRL